MKSKERGRMGHPLREPSKRVFRIRVMRCLNRQTVLRAIRVSLVVGPILGFINHFDILLGGDVTPVRLVKISLTFLVPFSVSAYSTVSALMADQARDAVDTRSGADRSPCW